MRHPRPAGPRLRPLPSLPPPPLRPPHPCFCPAAAAGRCQAAHCCSIRRLRPAPPVNLPPCTEPRRGAEQASHYTSRAPVAGGRARACRQRNTGRDAAKAARPPRAACAGWGRAARREGHCRAEAQKNGGGAVLAGIGRARAGSGVGALVWGLGGGRVPCPPPGGGRRHQGYVCCGGGGRSINAEGACSRRAARRCKTRRSDGVHWKRRAASLHAAQARVPRARPPSLGLCRPAPPPARAGPARRGGGASPVLQRARRGRRGGRRLGVRRDDVGVRLQRAHQLGHLVVLRAH
jgi:hypothetical protein